MYCNNCGKHNLNGSKFCQHCGIKLTSLSSKNGIKTPKETAISNTPITKQRSTKLSKWIISLLVTIIFILLTWITYNNRQLLPQVIAVVQDFIEPSERSSTSFVHFNDPHGRFITYLPTTPTVEKYTFVQQGNSMSGYLYTCNINDDESVAITYMEDPNTVFDKDADDTLDRVVNGFLININGIMVNGGNNTFLNYPSIDFVAKANIDNKTTYVKGIIFVKDKEVYSIVEYDKTQKFSKFEKIRNSFELN